MEKFVCRCDLFLKANGKCCQHFFKFSVVNPNINCSSLNWTAWTSTRVNWNGSDCYVACLHWKQYEWSSGRSCQI